MLRSLDVTSFGLCSCHNTICTLFWWFQPLVCFFFFSLGLNDSNSSFNCTKPVNLDRHIYEKTPHAQNTPAYGIFQALRHCLFLKFLRRVLHFFVFIIVVVNVIKHQEIAVELTGRLMVTMHANTYVLFFGSYI